MYTFYASQTWFIDQLDYYIVDYPPGHECLEQAITYWEDALDLLEYLPGEGGVSGPPALPTPQQAKLAKELQVFAR